MIEIEREGKNSPPLSHFFLPIYNSTNVERLCQVFLHICGIFPPQNSSLPSTDTSSTLQKLALSLKPACQGIGLRSSCPNNIATSLYFFYKECEGVGV